MAIPEETVEAVKKIQALINSGMTGRDAIKEVGTITEPRFYVVRKKLGLFKGRGAKPEAVQKRRRISRPKMETLVVPEVHPEKIVLLMISPNQLTEVLSSLRGSL